MNDLFVFRGNHYVATVGSDAGVPFIGMEDGKIVNNLKNPTTDIAQDYLLKMYRNNMPYPKWEHNRQINPSNISQGKTLFYPCGIWALYEADLSDFGAYARALLIPRA
ncbi:MAG: hypothetical protein ACI4XA_03240 [Oscillospiraceae bacterium]